MHLVTGCAGFIGSHLTERLLREGKKVIGIDNFSDYYPRGQKEMNMDGFIDDSRFQFIEGDINSLDLQRAMRGVEFVFHEAAQAGVRDSWGKNFDVYVKSNVLATQRMLEACRGARIRKFIYASSSSVYGDAESLPTREDALPRPLSPYGVSKLSGEHLCLLYNRNFGVPVVVLRYFSVYGPRQRPDMAFRRFIGAVLSHQEISVFGDGGQTRDFTYVSDVVDANMLAMGSGITWGVFNIGGGSRISVNEALGIIQRLSGVKARVRHEKDEKGDVRDTGADISKAREMIGYSPKVKVEEGLAEELGWIRSRLKA